MKFGISFLPDADQSTMSPGQYYSNALELSKIADQGGFSKVKMTEHYLHPYGGYCPSPLTFLAAVAAATKNIRLITGCVLPAFHHPVKLAAWTAMVDAISNGRLDVGFARAYLPYEFDTFGVSMDESRDRYISTIDAVIRLWTEQNVTIDSPFFVCKNANSLPKPTQVGHPPVWGAATRSRQSFSWIGSKGFGLLVTNTITSKEQLAESIELYRDCFLPSKHEPHRKAEVALSLPIFLDNSNSKAIAAGSQYLSAYFKVWIDSLKSWNAKSSNDYPGYTGVHNYVAALKPEDLIKTKSLVCGDPSSVIDSIHEIMEWYELDEILWQIDFGAMPLEQSKNTLNMLIDKVLPSFL